MRGDLAGDVYGRTRYEGQLSPESKIVQGARGQHFAGPGFSLDGGDAEMARGVAHLRKEPLHGRAAADHLAEGEAMGLARGAPRMLFRELAEARRRAIFGARSDGELKRVVG